MSRGRSSLLQVLFIGVIGVLVGIVTLIIAMVFISLPRKHVEEGMVKVPNLIGKSKAVAIDEIRKERLAYKTITQTSGDAIQLARVVNQKPAAGSMLKPGDTVEITIGCYQVPELKGMGIEAAQQLLDSIRKIAPISVVFESAPVRIISYKPEIIHSSNETLRITLGTTNVDQVSGRADSASSVSFGGRYGLPQPGRRLILVFAGIVIVTVTAVVIVIVLQKSSKPGQKHIPEYTGSPDLISSSLSESKSESKSLAVIRQDLAYLQGQIKALDQKIGDLHTQIKSDLIQLRNELMNRLIPRAPDSVTGPVVSAVKTDSGPEQRIKAKPPTLEELVGDYNSTVNAGPEKQMNFIERYQPYWVISEEITKVISSYGAQITDINFKRVGSASEADFMIVRLNDEFYVLPSLVVEINALVKLGYVFEIQKLHGQQPSFNKLVKPARCEPGVTVDSWRLTEKGGVQFIVTR